MKTQIKFDTVKENVKEIESVKIVAVVSEVHFHLPNGKVLKAKNATSNCLALTVQNGEVSFNRKLIFYE